MAYADPERRREFDRERLRRRTAERAALGLCPRCGRQAPASGRAVCGSCAEKRRTADRARAAKRRAVGIRRIRNPESRQAEYQRARERAAERLAQGLCNKCGLCGAPHKPHDVQLAVMLTPPKTSLIFRYLTPTAHHAAGILTNRTGNSAPAAARASGGAIASGTPGHGTPGNCMRVNPWPPGVRTSAAVSGIASALDGPRGFASGAAAAGPPTAHRAAATASRRARLPTGRRTPHAGRPASVRSAARRLSTVHCSAAPAPWSRPAASPGRTRPTAPGTPSAAPAGSARAAGAIRPSGHRAARIAPGANTASPRTRAACRSGSRAAPSSTAPAARTSAPGILGRTPS